MKSNLYKDDFWILGKSFLNEYLLVRRKYQPRTQETYKDSMNHWICYLKSEHGLEKQNVTFECFSRDKLNAYVDWMIKEKGFKASTVNLRLASLTSFLEYASNEDSNLIPYHNIISNISRPKQSKNPILFIEPDAMTAILMATPTDTNLNRRNRMIIVLVYETGCRVSELPPLTLRSLHIDDVDTPYITIVGKGNKTRNVPLSGKAVELLREYIKEFHRFGKNQPLFYSRKNRENTALSVDTYQNVLKRAVTLAKENGCRNLPDDISIHLIRKTRAMDLYRCGVDIYTIAQLLGHESVNTTNGFYAFAGFEMIADALKKIEESGSSFSSEKKWKESIDSKMEDFLYSLN